MPPKVKNNFEIMICRKFVREKSTYSLDLMYESIGVHEHCVIADISLRDIENAFFAGAVVNSSFWVYVTVPSWAGAYAYRCDKIA